MLLGTAVGDALGAGYEFEPPRPDGTPVEMTGGGRLDRARGEWTDDTSMALVIARVAAAGADLRDGTAQDEIAAGWADWARNANDVGIQTSAVIGAARRTGVCAASLRSAARDHHQRSGRSAGNGSLMRTAPVAIAYLGDEDGLVEAAAALSALTHFDPEAGEACQLWCLAIRHAVLTGALDVRVGLPRLDKGRAGVWTGRIEEAEDKPPSAFAQNGWVVQALQGAWSAISGNPVPAGHPSPGAEHLTLALKAAVRGGYDTDTVAAIAGGLLGGAYGASAVPDGWGRIIHGWPGLRRAEVVELATTIATHATRPARRE